MNPLLHFASLTVKAASSELMQMLEGRDDCRLMMTFACRRSPTHIAMNDVTPAPPSATKKSRPNAVMVAVIYCYRIWQSSLSFISGDFQGHVRRAAYAKTFSQPMGRAETNQSAKSTLGLCFLAVSTEHRKWTDPASHRCALQQIDEKY